MLKPVLTLYLCLMRNEDLRLGAIARLAAPVIISEFLEEALIVTDSILLSYMPSVYLASVGIIDAILLIILAYGIALNDSYQNYFARYRDKNIAEVIAVFRKAWLKFGVSGIVVSLFVILLSLFGVRFLGNNDVIECVGQVIWFILPLALCSYISMWLNSFLMGLGHYRLLAWISICCVVLNGVSGYVLLFKVTTHFSPTSIVLLTSALSELLAIIMMGAYVLMRYAPVKFDVSIRHNRLLSRIFSYASVYPAISEIGFHAGSLVLFLFCSYFFPQNQVALLTLIFSYWGLIQVPVDALQEITLNYFAEIYSKRQSGKFSSYSQMLIRFSRICCIMLFIIIAVSDLVLEGWSVYKCLGLCVVFVISLFACGTEVFNTSLIVRLKNDSYIISKLIFGVISCMLIIIGRFAIGIENVLAILIPFLLAQLAENAYSSYRARKAWS